MSSPIVIMAISASATLSACSGAMVAGVMPGETLTVNGLTYTVNQTPRGVTVQNFETGRTPPHILQAGAKTAAERVTGCPATSITQATGVNTYYVATACPDA